MRADACRCLFPLLAFLSLVTVAQAADERWTSTGPPGGTVRHVVAAPSDPAVLYAEARSGELWRSADHGATWQELPLRGARTQEFLQPRRSLSVHPEDASTVYFLRRVLDDPAGDVRRELWTTVDGGQSWRQVGAGLPAAGATGVVVDRQDPRVVWAGSFEGAFRSADGGERFEPARDGMPTGLLIRELLIDPQDPDTLLAGTAAGVYRTTDGGGTWQRASAGLPEGFEVEHLIADPSRPETYYAGGFELTSTRTSPLWKTVDGGDTWEVLGLPRELPLQGVAIDPHDPDRLVAIDPNSVWRSEDGGASWEVVSSHGELVFAASLASAGDAPWTLYAGAIGRPESSLGGGVARSRDGGKTWDVVGLPATQIVSLGASPTSLWAGARGGLFRSDDRGQTWEILRSPLSEAPFVDDVVLAMAVDPKRPSRVYASLERSYGYPSLRLLTRDNGRSWKVRSESDVLFSQLLVDPLVPDALWAVAGADGGAHPIWRSADAAANWTPVAALIGESLDGLALDPLDPRTLYAFGVGIYQSVDGGSTWEDAGRGLPDEAVRALAIDPSDGARLFAATGAGLFHSRDRAATWSLVNAEAVLDDLVIHRRSGVLVAVQDGAVVRSFDGGATWEPWSSGLSSPVRRLLIDPNDPDTVHAATDGGGVATITDGVCREGAATLCLDDAAGDRRFRVGLRFATSRGAGAAGNAAVTPLAPLGIADGGVWAFFSRDNPEALVKVLDGCAVNGHFWVFAAAATDVGFELEVDDTQSGVQRVYTQADGRPAATVTDIRAFATCGGDGGSALRRPPEDRPRGGMASACGGDASSLCLDGAPGDQRFRVRLDFATADGGGAAGTARGTPLAPLGIPRGGVLSFFSDDNPEVLIKVLDGCAINGRWWVFAAAATTVGFTLTVEDTSSGATRTYDNPDRRPAPTITDTDAFATCP